MLAGAVGIEPTFEVLEAPVLPLDDTPVSGGIERIRTFGTLTSSPVFETGRFIHSRTIPFGGR